jgi:mevalonate kinase
MYVSSLMVPAKAMLFGEYGVMYGYPSVAYTFYDYCFLIKIEVTPSLESRVNIFSAYFEEKKVSFSLEEEPSWEALFFYHMLKPWEEELASKKLTLTIDHSFSPSLGFGSSSALIAGVSYLLNQCFLQEGLTSLELWNKVRASLTLCQEGGSGYDVGVQLAALFSPKKTSQFWSYQLTKRLVPHIEELRHLNEKLENNNQELEYHNEELEHHNEKLGHLKLDQKETFPNSLGCFLRTGLYSNTREHLKYFTEKKDKTYWASEHGKIAEAFLALPPSLEGLGPLMIASFELAQKQGIVPWESPLLKDGVFLKNLDKASIPYKTMGSGFGDCLWVLASKEKLMEDLKVDPSYVAYAF